jgi:hypothetical protein
MAGHPGFRHLPFVDPTRDGERDPSTERSRADLYRGSLARNGRHVANIWTEMARAEDGLVVVHCRSGVDRTGMLVALLLSIAGVDKEVIGRDYAIHTSTDPHLSVTTGSVKDPRPPAWTGTPPDAETMVEVLEWLDATHGGAAGYLSALGVGEAPIAAVRRRLTQFP